MRAFGTGATGFPGGRLAEKLLARGDEVVALVRRDVDLGGARTVRGDLSDREGTGSGFPPARSSARDGHRPLRELISASDGVTYRASDAKARRETGCQPRSLAAGLATLDL